MWRSFRCSNNWRCVWNWHVNCSKYLWSLRPNRLNTKNPLGHVSVKTHEIFKNSISMMRIPLYLLFHLITRSYIYPLEILFANIFSDISDRMETSSPHFACITLLMMMIAKRFSCCLRQMTCVHLLEGNDGYKLQFRNVIGHWISFFPWMEWTKFQTLKYVKQTEKRTFRLCHLQK